MKVAGRRLRHTPAAASIGSTNNLFLFDFHKNTRSLVERSAGYAAHRNCARLSLRLNFFCAKLPIARGKREPGGHQKSSLNTGDGCATALAVASVVFSFSRTRSVLSSLPSVGPNQ